MEPRSRSSNAPNIGLREAVERVRALHQQVGQSPHDREVVARGIGYKSLSGASAMTISALRKYGLLEGRSEEIRVSDRAMAILHPHSDDEKQDAILAAAAEPEIFRELASKFPDHRANDELLRNYLVRSGYSPQAVNGIISVYKETAEFVGGIDGGYDSAPKGETEPNPMNANPSAQAQMTYGLGLAATRALPTAAADERQIGINDLEGGEYVRIVATMGVETEEALQWAEDIIARKRRELEMRKKQAPQMSVALKIDDGENNA